MINQPNPLGAFLQGRLGGQQYQAGQQQMQQAQETHALRQQAGKQGMNVQQQQQEQALRQEIAQALQYADTPEKWDQAINWFEQNGVPGAAQYRGQFELRPVLASQMGVNLPANVQEWEYFQRLPEDQQQQYLNLRRGGTVRDVGGVPTYVGGGGGVQTPLSTLNQEAEAKRTLAQAESEGRVQTGMERGPDGVVRPQPGAPLPAGTEDRIVEFTAAAQAARANAANYTQLADEMIAQMPQSGVAAEWADAFRTVTGTENAESLLRRRWAELRVGNAIQNLPPGVASDKDIELVMSAFLPTFAEPETVASFLRGLAKVEEIEAQYQEFRAQWMSNNGTARGMDEAWRQQLEAQSGGQSGGSQGDNDPLGLRGR